MKLVVNTDRWIRALWITLVILVLFSSIGQGARFLFDRDHLLGFVPLFRLNAERNVPTLFEALLMLGASMLLGVIAAWAKDRHDRDTAAWGLLSLGFLAMAVDELWSIHETLNRPMREWLGGENLGLLHFAWVLPALCLMAMLGVVFAGFLSRLPSPFARRFMLAGAVFVGGAVGVEMIGGVVYEAFGPNLIYEVATTCEEAMEMAGIILFIDALLDYIGTHIGKITFDVPTP